MKTEIKTVIFDIGNVIAFHDARIACKRFAEDMNVSFDLVWDHILTSKTEKAYTRGEINTYEFFRFCKKITDVKISYATFKHYWNDIFTENKGMDKIIKQLKKNYPLFIISNTNAMHYNYLLEKYPHVFKHFKRKFPSHFVGARKPDAKIYKRVLKAIGFRPEETVFIDDSRSFVAGAKAVGMHAIRYQNHDQLKRELRKLNVAI